jgi:hypothetical protein
MLTVGTLFGFYIGRQNNREKSVVTALQTENTIIPTQSNQIVDTTTQSTATSTKTITFPECNVSAEIPVREPLADGRYWQAPIGGASPNLLNLIYPDMKSDQYQQFSIMHGSDGEASGYIDSAVTVTCTKLKKDNITLNYEIINRLFKNIMIYNDSTFEKGMRPQKYEMTFYPEQKWGTEVMNVRLIDPLSSSAPDSYYTFIYQGKMFEIRSFGATTNLQVRQEQEQILNSLRFN